MILPLIYHGFKLEYVFDGSLYEGEIIGLDLFIKAYSLEQLEENFKTEVDKYLNN
jgi:hypothetical protein